MKRLVAAATIALTAAFAAHAQGNERPFKFVLGLGLTGGGDTLATVQYTNGNSQKIRAGGLVMLYGGGETRIGELVSLQATVGYHIDDTNANNGRVRFSRLPIDVLAIVALNDKVRFGAGAGNDADFDSTVGFVLEGEYRFTPLIGVKLRGVSEKFKESTTGQSISGNHFGLLMNLYF